VDTDANVTRRAAETGLADEVEALRCAILREKGSGAQVIVDTAGMRTRTKAAHPGSGRWDMKVGPGRLQEIELVAQVAGLRAGSPQRGVDAQLASGVRAGWPTKADVEVLLAAYRLCWRVHGAGRLLADGVLEPEALSAGACTFVLREAEADTLVALMEQIDMCTGAAAKVVDRLLDGGVA
jgi:glutamate-ammonia-ligase adenylyltransferase